MPCSSGSIYRYMFGIVFKWQMEYLLHQDGKQSRTAVHFCIKNYSECTHTLVCDTCMSILWYTITKPPQWNGLGVCISWSILGRCTGHPAMYMAAHVRTNPIFYFFILFFGFLIFEFMLLCGSNCTVYEATYALLPIQDQTIFFGHFFRHFFFFFGHATVKYD